MGERKRIKLRSGYIPTEKAPYPIENPWEGCYRQRFVFLNSENNTEIISDLSGVEIKYWIESLEEGLAELQVRMILDTENKKPLDHDD